MLHPDQPLQLGAAANLLLGLRADWMDTEGRACPFHAPARQPFETFAADAPSGVAGEWSDPTLSLHQDLDTLVDELFAYRVLPFSAASSGFSVPASALMLALETWKAAVAALSQRLGIDLEAAGASGFLLVATRRVAADVMHEAERGGVGQYIRIHNYWTSEGRNAMGRLRVSERIFDGDAREAVVTSRQARRYLDYFYEFGTHFVSRIAFGDALFQAFAIKPNRYRKLHDKMLAEAGATRVSGPLAVAFRFATTGDWASARGGIVSASDDPALARSLANGAWRDAALGEGDSLLAPFGAHPQARRALLASLGKSIPIAIDFAPQSSFMEIFRADAWKRLLAGAMLQRFGSRIRIPSARPIPASSTRAAASFAEFGLVARFGSPPVLQLPGARPFVFAYQAIASSPMGEAPTIAIEDDAFDRFEFVAADMRGALFVANLDESRRETICEGFRFATVGEADSADGARVVLRGDTWSPSVEAIRQAAPAIEASLEFAEALLSTREAPFARDYLEWLGSILGEDSSYSELRIRALSLAREARPLERVEPSRAARDDGWLADVLELANRILILATQGRASAAESNSTAFASALGQAADQAEALLARDALATREPSSALFEKGRLLKVATRLFLRLDQAVAQAGLESLGAPDEPELGAVAISLIQSARALSRCVQSESVSPRLKASET